LFLNIETGHPLQSKQKLSGLIPGSF